MRGGKSENDVNQDPNVMRNLTPRRVRVRFLRKHLLSPGGIRNAGEVGLLWEGHALELAEEGIVTILDEGRER